MSEGFWLFTIEMTMKALGNKDLSYNHQCLCLEAKIERSKFTLLYQTFEIANSKEIFRPPGRVIDNCAFD